MTREKWEKKRKGCPCYQYSDCLAQLSVTYLSGPAYTPCKYETCAFVYWKEAEAGER